jgi:hypothetical protein
MPAPADVQTTDGGGNVGKPQKNDRIVLTFAGAVTPSAILPGWNGAPIFVTVRIANNGKNDIVTVRDASTSAQLTELGSVQLGGNYSNNANFTGSTMTASGNKVTIVLGNPSGVVHDNKKTGTMVWTTPNGAATESGAKDVDF